MDDATTDDFGLLRLPSEIRFGAGAVATVPSTVARLGARVLVCADAVLAATPTFGRVVDGIRRRGVEVLVVSDVPAELPLESVRSAAARTRAFAPDAVLGYGGGSSIDLAKIMALLAVRPDPVSDYYGENRIESAVLPVVAVPTTAGTGSEVTPVAVLSDPDRALKVGISDPALIPRVAVVDPELTVGAPPSVTAHSGIDAFVHAVESLTAARRPADWSDTPGVFVGRNRLGSTLALEAVTLLSSSLRAAVADGTDLAARAATARGSLLAGMAFGSAGTHLSHAVQYPVGALTHTPHGLGTGLMLPFVLEACAPAIDEELELIGGAMGLESPSASATIAAVRSLVHDIGIPASLADIGVEEDAIERVADLALGADRLVRSAPVAVDRELMLRLVRHAWRGAA